MNVLYIALKDLQLLVRERGQLFQLFILPLLFIFVLSGALGSIGKSEAVALPTLAIVDQDGGTVAGNFIDKIQQEKSFSVVLTSASAAQAQLDASEVVGWLTIPQGFTNKVEASQPVTVVLTTGSTADTKQVEAARLLISSIAADISLEGQIIASLQQLGEMRGSLPAEAQVFDTQRILAQARQQFTEAQARPLIQTKLTVPQSTQEVSTSDLSQTTIPGFTVLFVFLAAQSTARSIYEEKKMGTFRRLVAAPLTKAEMLAGKLLPNFLTNLAQIVIIFAFGSLGMHLLGMPALPIENEVGGTILIAIVLALCSSALGIAIAGLARTDSQISGVSTILLWGMGLVGGSLVPLFIIERFLGQISMIVPHYWANRAFADLLVRHLGMAYVGRDVLVLFGFCIIFFVIGLWRFDFER